MVRVRLGFGSHARHARRCSHHCSQPGGSPMEPVDLWMWVISITLRWFVSSSGQCSSIVFLQSLRNEIPTRPEEVQLDSKDPSQQQVRPLSYSAFLPTDQNAPQPVELGEELRKHQRAKQQHKAQRESRELSRKKASEESDAADARCKRSRRSRPSLLVSTESEWACTGVLSESHWPAISAVRSESTFTYG
jgi:hypothetical protein